MKGVLIMALSTITNIETANKRFNIQRPVSLSRKDEETDNEYYARIAAQSKELWIEKQKCTNKLKTQMTDLKQFIITNTNIQSDEKKKILDTIADTLTLFSDRTEDDRRKVGNQILIDEHKACATCGKLINEIYNKTSDTELLNLINKMEYIYETREADSDGIKAVNNEIYNFKKLWNFSYKFIQSVYLTYYEKNPDDVMGIVFQTIYENIRNYDGSTDISTFIVNHIRHAMAEYVAQQQEISRYRNEVYIKINKVVSRILATEIIYQGNSENIPIAKIMEELPQYSYKQIVEALGAKEATQRESFNPDLSTAASFDTPEKAIEEKENIIFCHTILASLNDVERAILNAHVGNWKHANYEKDLAEDDDFLDLLVKNGLSHMISKSSDGHRSISLNNIKILLNHALNEARENPEVKASFDKKNDSISANIAESIIFDNIEDALQTQIEVMEFC